VEQVVAFSRWVGLVVAVFAALLLAPHGTSALWRRAKHGFRRIDDDPLHTPVHVREGVRSAGRRHLQHFHGTDPLDEAEVIDTHARQRRRRRHVRRFDVGWVVDLVDSRAALVLVVGLLLVFAGDLVQLLPGGAVLAGDLGLVAVTFLVMRQVIYTYVPVERVVEAVRPRVARAHAPFDQVLRLVLLATAVTLLVTWPSQVGWQLATNTLGGQLRDSRAVIAWACELPWLMGLTWLVVRQRLATASPARR
jgi:hypothetical protein